MTGSRWKFTPVQTPKDRYRYFYFEALEQATGEIERRFQQSDLDIINKLEILLLLNAGNGKETLPIPKVLSNFLAGSIDMDCLKIQLPMVYDMIKTASDGTNLLKSRLSVSTFWHTDNSAVSARIETGLTQNEAVVSLRLTNFIFTSL